MHTSRDGGHEGARENLKLQAKTAIMIIAPKKLSAAMGRRGKPLPVRLRSSVGVRREGGRRASLFLVIAAAAAWVKPS